MSALPRVTPRAAVVVVAAVLLAATFLLVRQPAETKTVTAHFPRAVSVYEGTDVRVLGVNVGRVTAVIPEGNSVRVEMEYDADVEVPKDARATVLTPTLVADRFVQLTPVYTDGPTMADGADIPLPDTGVPVELDRIYASIRDLSEALGPNGVNRDGTLNHLLAAGAHALDGQGQRGNEMIQQLSEAAATFGQGAGPLFDTVEELARFTDTLATNDKLVRAFVQDLAGVSSSLVSERVEIQRALRAVADSVGTVKTFVQGNRRALVTDVEKLTALMKTINSERSSIDTALSVAPVAIGNLTLAYNQESGTIGSRIGIQGQLWDADGFLCAIVQQSQLPRASKNLACTLFEQLLEPTENQLSAIPGTGKQAGQVDDANGTGRPADRGEQDAESSALANRTQAVYAPDESPSVTSLLGGAR
ncbi:MAG TPA: MCE family protein [Nocardioides sp.]|uniref:MCE family protein n=1 Tax=uncultured Nocardioides sp. TaxID=198441 RepID=UPI002631450F|nr:MCE family protein [uncultured Nocardioides sp.]HRD60269.1 MCE family protein [Nocardioides sp.]HRI96439.1 MCE family protein [Nocardioides sp.]HRK46151.1 MCE family protein [Nocardioides sp.]